jgi:hypothetical protein
MARTAKWREKMEATETGTPVVESPGTRPDVVIGDVYRHRAEAEHYCVVRIVDDEVHYCTEKGGQWALIREMPYFELKRKARSMPLANAEGIVAEGTWIKVDNIKSRWEKD